MLVWLVYKEGYVVKFDNMQVEWYDLNIKVKYSGANSGGSTEIIKEQKSHI